MLKEKKTIKEKDTLFSSEENTTTTVEEIEKQLTSNQAKIDQAKASTQYAQNELELIKDKRASRELRIRRKQAEFDETPIDEIKKLSEDAPTSKAIELAERLGEAKSKLIEIQNELTAMQRAHDIAWQDEQELEAELQAEIQKNHTLCLSLETEIGTLQAERHRLHTVEGQSVYAHLEAELIALEAEDKTAQGNLETASKEAKSTRLQLIEKLAESISLLSSWPTLQSSIKSRDLYDFDASVSALESYISFVKFCSDKAQDINNVKTALPTHSLLNELSISKEELQGLSNGYDVPVSLQEKLERAESFLAKLKK